MSTSPLLIAPDFQKEEYMHVDPASARWEHLNFAARMLHQGETWESETGQDELALVVLGGICSVESNRGSWMEIGQRATVFDGMPYNPVVTAPGYDCYYLNMLAGSAQSLAASDDPDFSWVKGTWNALDPRVPLVTMDMGKL